MLDDPKKESMESVKNQINLFGRLNSTMKESLIKAETEAGYFVGNITQYFGPSIENFKSRTCVTPEVDFVNNIYTIKYEPDPL